MSCRRPARRGGNYEKACSQQTFEDCLGEPERITHTPWATLVWEYGTLGEVEFDKEERVEKWQEPR